MVESVQELLEQDEGRRLWPYAGTRGHQTWGIGHLLANGLNPEVTDLLNQAVDRQFQDDLDEATQGLMAAYPWFAGMNPIRQAALIDMAFNLGLAGLAEFKQFLGWMEAGQWMNAAIDLRGTLVYRQLPTRYERLARMIQSGEWPA